MTNQSYSAALTADSHRELAHHLLQHMDRRSMHEDLCFALWRPSTGVNRTSALILKPILPVSGDRNVHGNASFNPVYFERALGAARAHKAGLVFLHSHPSPGWQSMSDPDFEAEQGMAPRVYGSTGLPLVGMTLGTDGAWSARFWERVGRKVYHRRWCRNVRVVGVSLRSTFANSVAPAPTVPEELARTVSAWGEDAQLNMSRLRVGIVGVGSIGSFVAESLARQGVEQVTLIDADHVKRHNLDRLLYAGPADIGRQKVSVCAERLAKSATTSSFQVHAIPSRVTQADGYRCAIDCDVLFSCVDRPWPRQILNYIAYTHLIPVIDAGIRVSVTRRDRLRGADWRTHTAGPGRPCLECLEQYAPSDVATERDGSFESKSYIESLPRSHFIHNNQNVFTFGMAAASLQMLQFISLATATHGVRTLGAQCYHMTTGDIDRDLDAECDSKCLYPELVATGEHAHIPPVLE